MSTCSRRAFLSKVGSGVLVGALGAGLTKELGLFGGPVFADGEALDFGKLEADVGAVAPDAENPYPVHHHMVAAGDARLNTGIPGYEASRDYVGSCATT